MKLRNFLYRITHWETWNPLAKYIPLSPAWFWYCIRSGSWWFFTPSNPTLTFGGFEGESKREMYDQLPPGSYPKSIFIKPSRPVEEVEQDIAANGLVFPLAVKPDVGMKGYMFRIMEDSTQFQQYHASMPVDYIVQELINYPIEVSVFYYRFPGEMNGTITGFLKKEYLEVTGDGESTLWQLIKAYPRTRFMLKELRTKHAERLQDVIPKGDVFRLSSALNLNRGCKMVSLSHEKNDKLLQVFDELSHYSKHFYYGRYDIKCQSIEDLQEGRNFSIMEYNGCGAEPHHIYGDGNNIFQAYKIVLHHWKVLYEISRHNHRSGVRYWDARTGFRFLREAKRHFKVLKELDAVYKS